MDKTPAEAVAWARSVLEAVTDNAAMHAENCPVCTNRWKCDTARYWADAGELAEEQFVERQQELRRAVRGWRRRFAHYLRHGYPLGNCPTCTWTYPNTGARYQP